MMAVHTDRAHSGVTVFCKGGNVIYLCAPFPEEADSHMAIGMHGIDGARTHARTHIARSCSFLSQ